MYLELIANNTARNSLTLLDETGVDRGYQLTDEVEWGDAVWEPQFSGSRGTQGARAVSSAPKDRPVVLPLRLRETSKDALAHRLGELEYQVALMREHGGKITWRSNGQTARQHFTVLSGSGVDVQEVKHRFENLDSTVVLAAFQCSPYVSGDPLDVVPAVLTDADDFVADAGNKSLLTLGDNGGLVGVVGETRLTYTDRPWLYRDHEVTAQIKFPAVIPSSFTAGVILKRFDANNYLAAVVDKVGSTITLQLRRVTGGVVFTAAGTVTVTTVPASSADWHIRANIVNGAVKVDLFTSAGSDPEPILGSTPAYTLSTLVTGDNEVAGRAGFLVTGGVTVKAWGVRAFVFRDISLPAVLPLRGGLPGTADALVDVSVTAPAGVASTAAPFALIGWNKRIGDGLKAPFGVFASLPAEAYSKVGSTETTWKITDPNSYDGSLCGTAAADSAAAYRATWPLDPQRLGQDPYSDEQSVEVWAMVRLSSTLVAPRVNVKIDRFYTAELGAVGKVLPVPTSGTVNRFVRLGSIAVPTTLMQSGQLGLRFEASVGAGSSGAFGLDHLICIPTKKRAASPTGKTLDSSYPRFMDVSGAASTQYLQTKTVRSDLRGVQASFRSDLESTPLTVRPHTGLGGELIEMPAGPVDTLIKLSNLVPDSPTIGTDTATVKHTATVAYAVTPRFNLLTRAYVVSGENATWTAPAIPVLTPYRDAVLTDIPTAYWQLNDNPTASGHAMADVSGNGWPGVYMGVATLLPTKTTGLLNPSTNTDYGALAFSGGSDRDRAEVPAAHRPPSANRQSLSFWMKPTGVTATTQIAGDFGVVSGSTVGSWQIYLSGGRLYYAITTNTGTFSVSTSLGIAAGVKTHVAATWDGSNIRLFVNGLPASTTATTGTTMVSVATPITIGGATTHSPYQGILDEFAIWNSKALAGSRILAQYNAGRTIAGTGYADLVLDQLPEVYFRLGDPSGSTDAMDSSGNGRHATKISTNAPIYGAAGGLTGDANTAAQLIALNEVQLQAPLTHAQMDVNGAYTIELMFKVTAAAVTSIRKMLVGIGANSDVIKGTTIGYNPNNSNSNNPFVLASVNKGLSRPVSSPTYPVGSWLHVALVVDTTNSVQTLYVNGAAVQTSAALGTTAPTSDPLTIGGGRYTNGGLISAGVSGYGFHQGSIDEIAVYSHALTAAQILSHAQAAGLA